MKYARFLFISLGLFLTLTTNQIVTNVYAQLSPNSLETLDWNATANTATSTNYRQLKSTIGAMAQNSQSANYRLRATWGQPSITGRIASTNYQLLWGYWGNSMMPSQNTYSINGRVADGNNNPITGVTISTGLGHTATTDATGVYLITGVVSGTYTLTPSKSNYTFTPSTSVVTVSSNITSKNFVGTLQTFVITGQVTDNTGASLSGVSISDGAGHSATTGANGTYSLGGILAGTYTLTPVKSGYTFSPPSLTIVVQPPGPKFQNFIGTYIPDPNCLKPLLRYWNQGAAKHFYTADWNELGWGSGGWRYEGYEGYVASTANCYAPNAQPLYRLVRDGTAKHYYTISPDGVSEAQRLGFRLEGTVGYVLPGAYSQYQTRPLYRRYAGGIDNHFYTINLDEANNALNLGYKNEGIEAYVFGAGSPFTPPRQANKTLDVRYVDQVYVQQKTEGGYWNHCGPASLAMVLHYEGVEKRDVLYDKDATLDLVCKVKYNCAGGSSEYKMKNVLENNGLKAYIDNTPTFEKVKQSIQNGHPVILKVWDGLHYVVAVGYKDDGSIIVNDPFGGYSWWPDEYSKWNTPVGSGPKLKGNNVTYSSMNNFDMGSLGRDPTNAIFITGTAPRIATTAAINTSGGTLSSEGVRLDFSSAGTVQPSSATSSISVTYTPLLEPTQATNEFEAAITSFNLGATDTNGQPVVDFGKPYTLTIEVDPTIIENWGKTTGQFSELGSSATSLSTLNNEPAKEVSFVLAGWDRELQQWTVIPSTLDTTNGQLVAQTDRLTEFTVFVKQNNSNVYLPIIIHQ